LFVSNLQKIKKIKKDNKPIDLIFTIFPFSFLFSDKTVTIIEPCPTKTSVLALAVTCALMVLVYLTTLFFYYMKKWMQPHKMMA
jgi:hypothetical protein